MELVRKIFVVAATLLIAQTAVAQKTPEEIYNNSCKICHATGIAGAPKKGDAQAWKPRMDLGIDAMVKSVTNGKGAMPPKGMCNDCTAERYQAVIKFMAK